MTPASDRVARVFLGALFVHAGRRVFFAPAGPAAKVEAVLPETHRAASAARVAVKLNAALMCAAGATLCLGVAPRQSALLLAACLQPTNLVGHAFWSLDDPHERSREVIAFLSNLAITGGLISVGPRG